MKPSCRLLRLKNRKILANEILGLSPLEMSDILSSKDSYYKVREIEVKGKKRLIEEPKGKLKAIHKVIAKQLTYLDAPDYLMSK